MFTIRNTEAGRAHDPSFVASLVDKAHDKDAGRNAHVCREWATASRARRGFTLVEVLLAMVILSTAAVVLLTGASRCLAVMKISRNHQVAQWAFGQGELEHPVVVSNDVKELEVDPVELDGLQGFKFSRTVEDDEDEDGLYVVRTKVSWSETRGESCEELVRYVYQEPKKK